MDRTPRTWTQLTPAERDLVLTQFYCLGSEGLWERPVLDIIGDFDLAAKKHDFAAFFPGLPSDLPCEVCGQPVELKALTRIALKALLRNSPDGSHPPELLRHVPPGQERPIFYHRQRTAPCSHCGHVLNHAQNCPCQACKKERKAAVRCDSSIDLETRKRLERERKQWALARRLEKFDRRMRLQSLAEDARERLVLELPPEIIEKARALIFLHGRIESDGGLWLTVGTDPDLPPLHQLSVEPTPFDAWTVIAVLQTAGIARLVGVRLENVRDEKGWQNPVPVADYLLTIEPPDALALGLLDEATSTIWDAADLDAFELAMPAPVEEGA
ncbi:MAG: hypothetical protein SF066_07730 [Thermoanaerobaculia bacterium]|nr:hypothetical protein [Thermoanaerobaculia bacterium]